MTLPIRLLFLLALLVPGFTPATAADLTLDAASGHIVVAQINGRPLRLRVDPETSGFIILNPDAAAQAGLRPSMLGARTIVGPIRLRGFTKVAPVSIGGTSGKRRVIWTERQSVAGADGLIGPADMPFDRVTLELRAPAAGETESVLPMQFERSFGLFHMATFGTQPIRFRISTMRPNSIATAAAGAVLASLHGGAWSGEQGEQMIKYEVVRPVRPMTLAQPAAFAGLPLDRFHVRTSDNRGSASLPPDSEADPDEIVVTGERERQRARHDVSVGLDWLAACSRLSWDNRSKVMTLTCRPAARQG
jgi:hypothetical protein